MLLIQSSQETPPIPKILLSAGEIFLKIQSVQRTKTIPCLENKLTTASSKNKWRKFQIIWSKNELLTNLSKRLRSTSPLSSPQTRPTRSLTPSWVIIAREMGVSFDLHWEILKGNLKMLIKCRSLFEVQRRMLIEEALTLDLTWIQITLPQ